MSYRKALISARNRAPDEKKLRSFPQQLPLRLPGAHYLTAQSAGPQLNCVRALVGYELVVDASRDCAAAFASFSTALNEIVPVVAS
jgi:hypothetical protein